MSANELETKRFRGSTTWLALCQAGSRFYSILWTWSYLFGENTDVVISYNMSSNEDCSGLCQGKFTKWLGQNRTLDSFASESHTALVPFPCFSWKCYVLVVLGSFSCSISINFVCVISMSRKSRKNEKFNLLQRAKLFQYPKMAMHCN